MSRSAGDFDATWFVTLMVLCFGCCAFIGGLAVLAIVWIAQVTGLLPPCVIGG